MNRADLQDLARLRIREAQALLAVGEWSGAYYLAGYSVECGLKASIARQFKRFEWPDKALVIKSYTHDLPALLGLAGLERPLNAEMSADRVFRTNWLIVKDWTEGARYVVWSRAQASDLIGAVTDRSHGVLGWIKRHW